MKDDEALNVHAQLHGYIGSEGIVVGVIGEAAIETERTKAILYAIGGQLARDLKGRVVFLTCGYGEEGVQAAFSEACQAADPLAVYDLQPRGAQDPLSGTQMIVAGNDVDHMLQIYTQVCDVYITAEGADLVTEATMLCAYWGAVIIPLISTGGASCGEHHFPAGCLTAPPCVPEAEWAVLSEQDATPQTLAQGVSRIFGTLMAARSEAVEIHKKHAQGLWSNASKKMMKAVPKPKTFDRSKVVTDEEAKLMEDLDFEAVLAAWKPKGARSGGAVQGNIDASAFESAAAAAPPKESEAVTGPPPVTARETAALQIGAPPPPSSDEAGESAIDDISEMRKRMEARLEEVHQKTSKATTKLQAVFRGRVARRVVEQMKEKMAKEGAAGLTS
eukprot:SRR837773.7775.p1 GENE.SRR837773.7775~~SRR837773.7775.p1  ORF type:complete len:412 (-),score=171.14 SRR837773.7775:46-1212(-)